MDKRPLRKRTSSEMANQQGKLILCDRANTGDAKPGVTRSVCGLRGTVDESLLSEDVSLKPLGGQSPRAGRQVTAPLSVAFSVLSVPLWLIVFRILQEPQLIADSVFLLDGHSFWAYKARGVP